MWLVFPSTNGSVSSMGQKKEENRFYLYLFHGETFSSFVTIINFEKRRNRMAFDVCSSAYRKQLRLHLLSFVAKFSSSSSSSFSMDEEFDESFLLFFPFITLFVNCVRKNSSSSPIRTQTKDDKMIKSS